MNANCNHHKEAEKPHSFPGSCLQYELTPVRRASQLPTSQSECIGNTIIQISTPDQFCPYRNSTSCLRISNPYFPIRTYLFSEYDIAVSFLTMDD